MGSHEEYPIWIDRSLFQGRSLIEMCGSHVQTSENQGFFLRHFATDIRCAETFIDFRLL